MGKLITLIIIVSTVWSVISGLIEKHKKDKIKASQRGLGSTQTKQAQQSLRVTLAQQATPAELFEARINALRQRPPKSVPSPQPIVVEKTQGPTREKIKYTKPLHRKECPLPPSRPTKRKLSKAKVVSGLLNSPQSLRRAIILTDVLSKPLSQR